MSSYHRQFEAASLPGILGFIQNQMGQKSPTPRRNPPARGSFAAFYEPPAFCEPEEDVRKAARSDSLPDMSMSETEEERDLIIKQKIQKERHSRLQEGRYEAHRKASRMPDGFVDIAPRR